MRATPLLVLFPALLAASGCERPTEAASPAAAVSTGRTLVALARIEPRGGVVRVNAGGTLARILVREGERVQVGTPLVELAGRAQRQAEHQLLLERIAEAERRVAAEAALHRALIEEAKLERASLESLQPLDLSIAEAQVRLETAELAYARAEAERLEKLRENSGTVSEQSANEARLRVDRSGARLDSARLELERARARQALDRALADQQVEARQAELERARLVVALDGLKAEVPLSQARLDETLIKSPIDGEVLQVLARPGEVGGAAVMQLGDTDQMYAVAEVYQTDVHLVRPGQPVVLTSQALPAPIPGAVESVGLVVGRNALFGEDASVPADARVFTVRIRLDQSDVARRFTWLEVEARIDVSGGAPAR